MIQMNNGMSQRPTQNDREDRAELLRGCGVIEDALNQDAGKLTSAPMPRQLTEHPVQPDRLLASVRSASTMVRDCAWINWTMRLTAPQTQSVTLGLRSVNLGNVRSGPFSRFG